MRNPSGNDRCSLRSRQSGRRHGPLQPRHCKLLAPMTQKMNRRTYVMRVAARVWKKSAMEVVMEEM